MSSLLACACVLFASVFTWDTSSLLLWGVCHCLWLWTLALSFQRDARHLTDGIGVGVYWCRVSSHNAANWSLKLLLRSLLNLRYTKLNLALVPHGFLLVRDRSSYALWRLYNTRCCRPSHLFYRFRGIQTLWLLFTHGLLEVVGAGSGLAVLSLVIFFLLVRVCHALILG